MRIILNNRQTVFDANEMSIEEIMAIKSFTFKMLIVKLNGILIKKDSYPTVMVRDGDTLDIIHLVSGG